MRRMSSQPKRRRPDVAPGSVLSSSSLANGGVAEPIEASSSVQLASSTVGPFTQKLLGLVGCAVAMILGLLSGFPFLALTISVDRFGGGASAFVAISWILSAPWFIRAFGRSFVYLVFRLTPTAVDVGSATFGGLGNKQKFERMTMWRAVAPFAILIFVFLLAVVTN